MQPPCPLQRPPCRPSPSLGSQLEEKLLFEKFWKGTFKAVASPRPESVIVASITARRRVSSLETTACQPLKLDEKKAAASKVDAADGNGCLKGKGRKRHRKARSPSFDEEVSPRPKGRKKRKSERKRKRSPSRSLSPPRKKKKKKKKSSKKSKRHRYSSKKSKHSSSSLKRKRKEERKHKKRPFSSRTHSRRRRRYQRSDLDSSPCQSSREDRHHLQKSVVHRAFGDLAAVVEDSSGGLGQTDMKWRPAAKSLCKTAPKYRSILSTATVLPSRPGSRLSRGKGSRHSTGQSEGLHSYDSGNDTSSPPSSKTAISPASVTEGKRGHCKHLDSPERLRVTDNVSDSGNSVTSYDSLCKSYREDGFPATLFSGNNKREEISVGCRVEVRPQKTSSCSQRTSRSPQSRRSCSSARSSGSSEYCGRHSRSLSLSSCSSYSRSPSYPLDLRRRGSVASLSSAGSYCRYSSDRRRSSSSRETGARRSRKSRKRRRRKSYSPLKKRRRDSPSHLEARRITSARKRPIPYFRPSPSSSSRSTSISSWSSIFSRSRSRSHRYSSYRSNSRSSSWNSVFGSRSRSPSPDKRARARH